MIKITNSTDLKQEKTNFNSQLIKMVLTKILNQNFFQKRNKKKLLFEAILCWYSWHNFIHKTENMSWFLPIKLIKPETFALKIPKHQFSQNILHPVFSLYGDETLRKNQKNLMHRFVTFCPKAPEQDFPKKLILLNIKPLCHFDFMQNIRKVPCIDFW